MFYSKLLLFGEYGIILNSKGLTTPFRKFAGSLEFPGKKNDPDIIESNKNLKEFFEYIQDEVPENIRKFIRLKAFEEDLKKTLYLKSTIPQGYGAGSSGALVAAVFKRYAREKCFTFEINDLKKTFATLESYFHGQSSGYDPLVSYLNKPILIQGDGTIENIELNKMGNDFSVFLVDTRKKRQTKNLVNKFMDNIKNPDYKDFIYSEFIRPTNRAISHFLENNVDRLFTELERISRFQYENFAPMIPIGYRELFRFGLESGDYCLKLCGSGGGGFLYGFTRDMEKAKEVLDNYDLQPEVINEWL